MKTLQHEMPIVGAVFNLAGESGDDPFRLEREAWEAAERQREGREYAARMQHTFEQCPGFIGGDCPTCDSGKGVVIVEPAQVVSALAWLKRRFHASENIELSPDGGIAIEIAPRVRRSPSGGKKIKVKFGKVEQFALPL